MNNIKLTDKIAIKDIEININDIIQALILAAVLMLWVNEFLYSW